QKATLQRQQAAQAATQQRQSLLDQMDVLGKGGIPAETITQDPSGLKIRQPNPAAGTDPSRMVTLGSGQKYYIPTSEEQGTTFVPVGQLADHLEAAGHKRGTPITPTDSFNTLRALNEAQPTDEPYDIDTSGKFVGPDGKPVPV